ncbi:hypothetical protein [Chryseobacterium kwangjuense]|uniref:Uncharacterized protein n=1 Tax=Chryseobacterium kwangjuense TaxID=267125 RepID=A0A135WI72_9FLAO|nr:hypothetical protein [Chryseobacterium kwangjuense]KXH84452.1 hypothetical protein AU378_01440 [Chryseobacterium kwangjuense]
MRKEILKQLKSDYERLEIKPSSDLWDRMEQEMGDPPAVSLKKPFQWWEYAAAVLVLLSVGTVLDYNLRTESDQIKTDYIVKEKPRKKVDPAHSDLFIQSVISDEKAPQKNERKIAAEDSKKIIIPEKVLTPEKEIKVNETVIPEHKEQQIAVHQTEEIKTVQKNAEINHSDLAVIAEAKRAKSNYINPDELLLGRELDKTRERSSRDDRKYGVIKLHKIVPDVGNVTVLGVTVYLDPK